MRTRNKEHSGRHEDGENGTPGSAIICKNHGNQKKQTGRNGEDYTQSLVESTKKESFEQKGKDLLHVGEENIIAQQDAEWSFSSTSPLEGHVDMNSYWEDGNISDSNLGGNYPCQNGLTIEFNDLSSSSKRKSLRRVSAKEKELAELVHRVHLLCLIARGRLVDNACNDPLIQASLLSLVPCELLKLADAPKLTTNMLVPLVRWFNNNFKVRNPDIKEEYSLKNNALALGTHEGTVEEVVELLVALFRALNIPTRFVSILDVASLKPESSISGSSQQDVPLLDAKSSSLKVAENSISNSSSSPGLLQPFPERISQNGSHNMKTGNSDSQRNLSTDSDVVKQSTNEISCLSTFPLVGNEGDTHCTLNDKKTKRKGDLEFELQLEMALTATAAVVHNNGPSSCMNNPVDTLHQSPSKKLKTEAVEPLFPTKGDQGAVWSRRSRPPLCWSEVYCCGEAMSGRWVHVDPINAIVDGEGRVEAAHAACRKPLKYVVAFAGNGAKDVTRRYCTQWYKVAPHRACSEWWDAVLAPLKELESKATGGRINMGTCLENASCEMVKNQVKSNPISGSPKDVKDSPLSKDHGYPNGGTQEKSKQHLMRADFEASTSNYFTTRDSLEDMELETRALTEPLPTNQQAYRNHPLYAIEKWLTRYQILHPKGPILGYCSGHPVYPRDSVQILKTKPKWRCDGLQVKPHEVPAKVIKRSSKHTEMQNHDELGLSDSDNHTNIELYGRWQMEPLHLPRAVGGIVPKNERGQIDVWSEKCLPPGTVHLRLPRLVQVAKRLEIDFAPAMVGFDFRGGRAVPVFEGIVVCTEFKEAILAAYAEEEERREAEEKKRNEAQALSRWYQLISSMVTRDRLSASYGGASSSYSQPLSKQEIDVPKYTGKEDDLYNNYHGAHGRRTCVLDEDHEHTFPLEDQHFDEESSTRTKRCPCGFSIKMEEL